MEPKNTTKSKTSIWNQFSDFMRTKSYQLTSSTTNEQLAEILQNWASNMRKTSGEEYKESVVKTMWNVTAKLIQEKYQNDFNRSIDPFKDIVFKNARDARDSKRKKLLMQEKSKNNVTLVKNCTILNVRNGEIISEKHTKKLQHRKRDSNLKMKTPARWGLATPHEIAFKSKKIEPKNTIKTKTSIWKKFSDFLRNQNYQLSSSTTSEEIAEILKNWALNMRKLTGGDYKEGVVKTMWNVTAKLVQEKYYNEHNRLMDPFKDALFKDARDARDSKRKELQMNVHNSSVFTVEENIAILDAWNEETPKGLERKLFHSLSNELEWTGGDAVNANVDYFQYEVDADGQSTGRIGYNPLYLQMTEEECQNLTKWLTPYDDPKNCPVRLFNTYVRKRPQGLKIKNLFLTPNSNWKYSKMWYNVTPVGLNEVSKWTKEAAELINLNMKQLANR